MLIEVESVYGDKLIHGKRMEISEICFHMNRILATTDEKDFVAIFCKRTKYEAVEYDLYANVDYVIDLDIHKVYKPRY